MYASHVLTVSNGCTIMKTCNMYIFVYIYAHVYLYTRVHISTYAYIHIRTNIYSSVCDMPHSCNAHTQKFCARTQCVPSDTIRYICIHTHI